MQVTLLSVTPSSVTVYALQCVATAMLLVLCVSCVERVLSDGIAVIYSECAKASRAAGTVRACFAV
jgi:hypothetical protein